MRRRDFVLLLSGASLVGSFASLAQPAQVRPRIGFLSDQSEEHHPFSARDYFLKRLGELGYVDGQNITIEYRFAAGDAGRLPAMAAELAALPLKVIFTVGTPASKAAYAATKAIPIVFSRIADPVGAGLAASLAHPGGNATGTTVQTSDIAEKRLQLLKEAAPGITTVAVVHEQNFSPGDIELKQLIAAAPRLGLQIYPVGIQPPQPAALDAAAVEIAKKSPGALFVGASGWFEEVYQHALTLADKSHLPALYVRREFVDAGGLMSYGANYGQMYRVAVEYVDKILKGAKPGDLPVQQPIKIELVINLKTAKVLGLSMSPLLLAFADEVIE